MDNKYMPYDDLQFIGQIIKESRWIFAKTMPDNPHYYMLRKESIDGEFVRFVELIRKYGYRNKYGGAWYTQLNVDNWFYWTMGAPIPITILINRKERRLGIESVYDQICQDYEAMFANEVGEDEDIQIADYISRHNLNGRILEIGCGTGMVTRNLIFDRRQYLGIDPSWEMLEKFRNNPKLCDLQVLHTDFESFCPRGKYRCVFATYGAASYVRPDFWKRLNDILEVGGTFLLMFYADDYYPVTHIMSQSIVPYYSPKDFSTEIDAKIHSIKVGNYIIIEGVKL